MKKVLILLLTIALAFNISCEKSEIEQSFQCNSDVNFSNTKTYEDVLKHFKIDIPKKWKTNLYYDEYQSELHSADTTKQLSKTYIIDVAWHQGELNFNDDFEKKINDKLSKEKLKAINSGYGNFKDLPMYFNYAKGVNLKFDYHLVQIYVLYKPDEYYLFSTKFYGDKYINERICESFSLFENIKFNK